MATFKPDDSFRNIKDVEDVRVYLEKLNTNLKYMFSNLSTTENGSSDSVVQLALILAELKALDARVTALEEGE